MPEDQYDVGVEEDADAACPATIVVCAYTRDRWETLRCALDRVLKQISLNDELLVVVDHNDALQEQCRDSLNDLKIIPNHHERGLSGARNTAIEIARGSIIVFLDDDAVPLDGWLVSLRAPYADKRVYGVGGHVKPYWLGIQPRWFPEEFLWVVGCSYRGLPYDTEPVRNVIGANMSFRKSAFGHVGGFIEQMGRVGEGVLGCEETEFCIRLTQAIPDATILYEPSSQVEHHVARQRTSLRYFVRRCWAEGLSKAQVSRRVGRASALSSERHYVSEVLPKGIRNGIYQSLTGDIWGAARSAAIILGFAVTAAGYFTGTMYRRTDPRGVRT